MAKKEDIKKRGYLKRDITERRLQNFTRIIEWKTQCALAVFGQYLRKQLTYRCTIKNEIMILFNFSLHRTAILLL